MLKFKELKEVLFSKTPLSDQLTFRMGVYQPLFRLRGVFELRFIKSNKLKVDKS